MIIKTNNRAVDPNTVQGQVQVSSDGNAYGANTSGAQVMQAGLSEAQKQIQAYMEDQITMGVIDASNKYQQGLNDLPFDKRRRQCTGRHETVSGSGRKTASRNIGKPAEL